MNRNSKLKIATKRHEDTDSKPIDKRKNRSTTSQRIPVFRKRSLQTGINKKRFVFIYPELAVNLKRRSDEIIKRRKKGEVFPTSIFQQRFPTIIPLSPILLHDNKTTYNPDNKK